VINVKEQHKASFLSGPYNIPDIEFGVSPTGWLTIPLLRIELPWKDQVSK